MRNESWRASGTTCRICGKDGVPEGVGFHYECLRDRMAKETGKMPDDPFTRLKNESAQREREEWEEELRQRAERDAERKRQREAKEEEAYRKIREWWAQQQWWTKQQRPQQTAPLAGKPLAGSITITIDEKKLKQLLMLCHPDRHGGSERATEITRWLIDLKSKIQK